MSLEVYSNTDDEQQKLLMRRGMVFMLMERLTEAERKAVLCVPAAQSPEDLKLFARSVASILGFTVVKVSSGHYHP